MKTVINKFNFIKIKNFCFANDSIKIMKYMSYTGKNIFKTHT